MRVQISVYVIIYIDKQFVTAFATGTSIKDPNCSYLLTYM